LKSHCFALIFHLSGSKKSLIYKFFLKRKRFSSDIQTILEFMEKEIKLIECPKNQYSTGYYSEFNPGHVQFKNKCDYHIKIVESFTLY